MQKAYRNHAEPMRMIMRKPKVEAPDHVRGCGACK